MDPWIATTGRVIVGTHVPKKSSGPTDEDVAVDYTVLAYAAVDGVSRAQLMGQAFRSLSVEEKERSLDRLTRAGLASADDERIWLTPAGHAAMARITAIGERRGWAGYKRWIGAALYPNLDGRWRPDEESSSYGGPTTRPSDEPTLDIEILRAHRARD